MNNIDPKIIIGVCVGVCLLILILVISTIIKIKKQSDEKPLSILDVDLNGVPASEDRTFDYGYEKEDTVVMNPVKTETDEKEEKKKETKTKKK
ncbi:MAG: hypothetical protein J6O41_08425 [Clostridia bacterium]|nr:hypothetical protein [Clostridia bacterium]